MNQEHRPKGRGMPSRPSSSRGNRAHGHSAPSSQHQHDKYPNDRFTHFICTLVGKRVNLEVRNGKFYNGVLTTISPNNEYALSKVHMVEVEPNGKLDEHKIPKEEGHLLEKIIFKPKDIVTITCPLVDLEECRKGANSFQTDQSISHCVNGEVRERELQKWQADEAPQETPVLGSKAEKSNGWCPREMFKINEQRYGVTSDYDSDMTSYTTKLEKKDTEEYYEREKRAEKIAKEIEQNQHFEENIDSGKSEEELYSAVVRQQKSDSNYVPHHSQGRPVAVMERKDKGGSMEFSKTPSPHANSPVSSRKLNGEDARQKAHDSELTPKADIKARSPKGDLKGGKFTEQIKEKILYSKPYHVRLEERAQKANKSVDPKELIEFQEEFNLGTKLDEPNKVKKPVPETQDIRKLEESEKLRMQEAASPTPLPVTSTPSATETLVNEESKAQTHSGNKPSGPEATQSSPVLKSSLNPNAKEFKPTTKPVISKPSSPSQSQGIATPVQTTVVPQPSAGALMHRIQYPSHIRPRTRGGYPPRSEYHEQQYSSSTGSSIMTAAIATGPPIMAQPVVYQHQYPPNQVVMPNVPLQGQPMVVFGQRFLQPVGYNISAAPPVMPSGQGTMVTAGNYQTGTGSFQDGTHIPVYVSQPGNMTAPQHPLPGQHQPYPQHIMAATTPTGPPPPHQSPQPHPQPIFFQQQPSALPPPPNQPQHIMPPAGVAMPQPPQATPMLVMSQTPQNIQQSSPYNR